MAALAVLLAAAPALFAEDGLAVSGSANVGFRVSVLGEAKPAFNYGWGDDPIRPTVDFAWTKGATVFKWKLRTDLTKDGFAAGPVFTGYAFGTTDLFDGQLGISAGLIDGALWGSGGKVDANIDAITGVRFAYKPAFVEGLSAGLVLPLEPVAKPEQYFAELGFGAKYANDIFDVRLAVRLDSDADKGSDASWTLSSAAIMDYVENSLGFTPPGATYTPLPSPAAFPASPSGGKYPYFEAAWRKSQSDFTYNAATDDEGTKLIWGVGPKLETIIPGLTAWLDGQITGIGITDGVGTKTGLKAGFTAGSFVSSVGVALETFPKGKVKATGFYIDPAVSYALTSWLKAGLEANLTFYSYEDAPSTWYKTQYNEDLAAFDKFGLTLYADFTLGNGIVITPRYALTAKTANGPSIIEDADIASTNWDKARTDHRIELRFGYSF
jgi:hypothetical protein